MSPRYPKVPDMVYNPNFRGFIVDEEGNRDLIEGMIATTPPQGQAAKKRLLEGIGDPGSVANLPSGKSASILKVAGDIPEAVTVFAQIALGKNRQTNDDVFLRLSWGLGDISFDADVDLQKGVAIGLICKSLEVTAFNGGTASASIYVGAAVGYGMRGASAPPQRTLNGGAVAITTTGAKVTIPKFARGVYPIVNVTTGATYAADFVVRQLDKADNIIAEHPFIYSGAPYLSPARLMLLNDAYSLDVSNVDAANAIEMRWLFDLAF